MHPVTESDLGEESKGKVGKKVSFTDFDQLEKSAPANKQLGILAKNFN